jgi:arylsulfatase A-like enzyme
MRPLNVLLAGAALGLAAAVPPNLVFILVDDAGYGSWPNPEILTPNLDALAAESFRVPEAYAWQFCSPSRGAFLTGRYPWRLPNSRINLIPSYVLDGTPLGYAMLPQRLKPQGYTSYHVGKARHAGNSRRTAQSALP